MILVGDCVERMAELEEASVDAIVTDPPYGLEFMGKDWDTFRIDKRAARWSGDERTGGAGAGFGDVRGSQLPAFGKRRTTSLCRTCGKRDAFRNPHPCGERADWTVIPVDSSPMEMRAFQNWVALWAVEALRVLKPGGHLLAFGGTRTYHRLACGLEEAGFDIRDTILWLYGQGFPKSHNVSKAIDKAQGVEPLVVGQGENWGASSADEGKTTYGDYEGDWDVTEPVTADAKRWAGWGTALKPAVEPIVVARKVLDGSVAANVVKHGTGALNIEASKVGFTSDADEREAKGKNRHADFESGPRENRIYGADGRDRAASGNYDPLGRWPANIALDEEAAAQLDQQTGELASGSGQRRPNAWQSRSAYGFSQRPNGPSGYTRDGDAGGASRFFYVGKATTIERNAGLEGFAERLADPYGEHRGRRMEDKSRIDGKPAKLGRNAHPTVKPIALMRWLCRLVTPPGGLVLDPFAGSGTTGIAAGLEGFEFLGMEKEAEWAELAEARLGWWALHGEAALEEVRRREQAERDRAALVEMGQLGLFE